jgi:hypothetical protein
LHAFDQISIWLLRHQVWVETRKYKNGGEWIGPQVGQLNSFDYPMVLNPHGKCRCGSNKKYMECHRPSDLEDFTSYWAKRKNITEIEMKRQMINDVGQSWQKRIHLFHYPSLKILNNALHPVTY